MNTKVSDLKPSDKIEFRKQLLEAEAKFAKASRTNHILHLLLSIITVGIWIPIWVVISISNSMDVKPLAKRIAKLESVLDQMEA